MVVQFGPILFSPFFPLFSNLVAGKWYLEWCLYEASNNAKVMKRQIHQKCVCVNNIHYCHVLQVVSIGTNPTFKVIFTPLQYIPILRKKYEAIIDDV